MKYVNLDYKRFIKRLLIIYINVNKNTIELIIEIKINIFDLILKIDANNVTKNKCKNEVIMLPQKSLEYNNMYKRRIKK